MSILQKGTPEGQPSCKHNIKYYTSLNLLKQTLFRKNNICSMHLPFSQMILKSCRCCTITGYALAFFLHGLLNPKIKKINNLVLITGICNQPRCCQNNCRSIPPNKKPRARKKKDLLHQILVISNERWRACLVDEKVKKKKKVCTHRIFDICMEH
jgi:hypothetical protein